MCRVAESAYELPCWEGEAIWKYYEIATPQRFLWYLLCLLFDHSIQNNMALWVIVFLQTANSYALWKVWNGHFCQWYMYENIPSLTKCIAY